LFSHAGACVDRRAGHYDESFFHTHDPIGYIGSDLASLSGASQFSIPLASTQGPFSQDLFSQASQLTTTDTAHLPSETSGPLTQLTYDTGFSQSLMFSQSDRLQRAPGAKKANGGKTLPSYADDDFFEDYKSQWDDGLSQRTSGNGPSAASSSRHGYTSF